MMIWLGSISLAFLIFLLVIVAVIHFIPSIVAYKRRHRNILPIIIINIFFGWTLIGWVIALVWSLTDNTHANNGYITVTKVQ